MKHPNDVNSYVGGHCYITGIYDTEVSSDSEEVRGSIFSSLFSLMHILRFIVNDMFSATGLTG